MPKDTGPPQTANGNDMRTPAVGRRAFMQGLAISGCALAAGCLARSSARAEEDAGPTLKPGDRLALEPEQGAPKPLRVDDIKPGAALMGVYPIDPATGKLRNETRFNMLNVARLADVKPDSVAAAASGVVAYSAICTHKGCAINSWDAAVSHWRCFCHMSEFDATAKGEVVAGPATESLPMVALCVDAEGYIAATTAFSRTPGAAS